LKLSFHRRAFWSFAGLFLLGLAGWEAVQVIRGERTSFSKALLPPPLRSRSGERPALVRETTAGDPIANYLARAKRGMTESEVRWMLEDFQAAGLDQNPAVPEVARLLRKKQQEWYLMALKEGLSLTQEQEDQAKSKLEEVFARDFQVLQSEEWVVIHALDAPGGWWASRTENPEVQLKFWALDQWFYNPAAAPWNLCELDTAQKSLTLKEWVPQGAWVYTNRQLPPDWDPFSGDVLPSVPTIQDPVSGNLLEFSGSGKNPADYLFCAEVFPLTPDQASLSEQDGHFLAQARLCHPAQLRMALLVQRGLAQTLAESISGYPVGHRIEPPSK